MSHPSIFLHAPCTLTNIQRSNACRPSNASTRKRWKISSTVIGSNICRCLLDCNHFAEAFHSARRVKRLHRTFLVDSSLAHQLKLERRVAQRHVPWLRVAARSTRLQQGCPFPCAISAALARLWCANAIAMYLLHYKLPSIDGFCFSSCNL